MEQLEVKQISLVQLSELQKISRLTFADTFGAANTETDLKKYLDEAYSNQKLTKELNNPETFFYFGYIDHQLAGYLKLNVGKAQSDKVSNNSLEVERIYILPAFKRHGLGKKLIEVAESIAKQNIKIIFGWEFGKAIQKQLLFIKLKVLNVSVNIHLWSVMIRKLII